MVCVQERDGQVRAACEACGAEQLLPRFASTTASGYVRCEPEEGQWLQCRVCSDWSVFKRSTADRPVAVAG
jgi:hypothetical protein